MDTLPDEILVEILAPVSPRYMIVCRRWYNIIGDRPLVRLQRAMRDLAQGSDVSYIGAAQGLIADACRRGIDECVPAGHLMATMSYSVRIHAAGQRFDARVMRPSAAIRSADMIAPMFNIKIYEIYRTWRVDAYIGKRNWADVDERSFRRRDSAMFNDCDGILTMRRDCSGRPSMFEDALTVRLAMNLIHFLNRCLGRPALCEDGCECKRCRRVKKYMWA